MRLNNVQRWLEHMALLFASFVWTTVVLVAIILLWVYQDIQANGDKLLNGPPEALAQVVPITDLTRILTVEPATLPALAATATASPSPTPREARVDDRRDQDFFVRTIAAPSPTPIPPPVILPETVGIGEPTPIPIAVQQTEKITHRKDPKFRSATLSPPVSPTPITQPAFRVPPTVPLWPANPQPAPTVIPSPAPIVTEPAIPTRLEMPAIGVASKINPVGWQLVEQNGQRFSIWEVADYAVGWHQTSARLGQPGNTVMAGHNNIKGEVFRDLASVEIGDKIIAYAGQQKFEYIVELKTIVREKGEPPEVRQRNAQWIAPTKDERLTLVSCWPYTSNTHRVIVVAKPSPS